MTIVIAISLVMTGCIMSDNVKDMKDISYPIVATFGDGQKVILIEDGVVVYKLNNDDNIDANWELYFQGSDYCIYKVELPSFRFMEIHQVGHPDVSCIISDIDLILHKDGSVEFGSSKDDLMLEGQWN